MARLAMSRFACLLARPLTPVHDATSGLFVVKREAIEGVQISAAGFKICLELLMRSRIRSVAEIPYVFADRAAGESKMTLREALGYFVQLRDLYALQFLKGGKSRARYTRLSPAEVRQPGREDVGAPGPRGVQAAGDRPGDGVAAGCSRPPSSIFVTIFQIRPWLVSSIRPMSPTCRTT